MLDKVPEDILLEIVNRVGKSGFMNLSGLIRASQRCYAVVMNPCVLQNVNLDLVKEEGYQVRRNSPFLPFFRKCVEAGNVTARVLEGIRLAFTERMVDEGIDMIISSGSNTVYATYTLGMMQICAGEYESGCLTLFPLRWWDKIRSTTAVREDVRKTIMGMMPTMKGSFRFTLECPFPTCDCEGEEIGECEECFIMCNAILMAQLS